MVYFAYISIFNFSIGQICFVRDLRAPSGQPQWETRLSRNALLCQPERLSRSVVDRLHTLDASRACVGDKDKGVKNRIGIVHL